MSALALALALASAPMTEEALAAAVDKGPKDVSAFVHRRQDCNHFAGEEPYDEERAAYLSRTMRELKCERLERDEKRLRAKYGRRADVLTLLGLTADWI